MSAAEKIVIDGKEYSREEFRAKLIQNNWSEETDGTVMDALYNSFLKAMENNAANVPATACDTIPGYEASDIAEIPPRAHPSHAA